MFEIKSIVIIGIAVYFVIGFLLGYYVSRRDKKQYGDNRYLVEDLCVFLFLGFPTLIVMILAIITSGSEDLLQNLKNLKNRKPKSKNNNLCLPREEAGDL